MIDSTRYLGLEPWEIPAAEIERRMRALFQICKLGAALKHAKWLGPVEAERIAIQEPKIASAPALPTDSSSQAGAFNVQ